MRFSIFARRGLRGKRWYFNAKSCGNNKVLLQSEGYKNMADCMDTVRLIQKDAAGATVNIEEKY